MLLRLLAVGSVYVSDVPPGVVPVPPVAKAENWKAPPVSRVIGDGNAPLVRTGVPPAPSWVKVPVTFVADNPLIRSVLLTVYVCANEFVPFVWRSVVTTTTPLACEASPTNPTAPNKKKHRRDKDM